MQLGILESKSGRGPGSGVRLSAQALAVLLIAYAGVDSLADVPRTKRVCAANVLEHDSKFVCPITGKAFFLDILTTALAQPELASCILRIEIDLNSNFVLVSYFPRRRGSAPRHYGLYIPDEDDGYRGVLKRSIVRDLDRISLALAEFRKSTENAE
ncbi:hypothetical protein Q2941_43495 [Bradyrhizobium sp. UFLA05-153]